MITKKKAMRVTIYSIGLMAAAMTMLNRVPVVDAAVVIHISLLAQTMHPIDYTIKHDSSDGFLRTVQASTISGNPTAYLGQVNLPDGAQISAVRCFGLDSDPFFQFMFRLSRFNHNSNPVESAVTSLASSGNQPGKVQVSANVLAGTELVDNVNYSYAIYLELPVPYSLPYQDLWVSRCVVDITQATFFPVIQKN